MTVLVFKSAFGDEGGLSGVQRKNVLTLAGTATFLGLSLKIFGYGRGDFYVNSTGSLITNSGLLINGMYSPSESECNACSNKMSALIINIAGLAADLLATAIHIQYDDNSFWYHASEAGAIMLYIYSLAGYEANKVKFKRSYLNNARISPYKKDGVQLSYSLEF
jgi:hypothetical protein